MEAPRNGFLHPIFASLRRLRGMAQCHSQTVVFITEKLTSAETALRNTSKDVKKRPPCIFVNNRSLLGYPLSKTETMLSSVANPRPAFMKERR